MNILTGHQRFMTAALSLGRRGLGRTAPNPAVGALVVKDGVVIGRGWTQPGGRPHAETMALAEAGADAKDATIYVTLEPCSHHGRTGPCCEAIVGAGITRLVYATDDPNPLVSGRGAEFCRRNGIEVVGGVLADAASRDHRGHTLLVTQNRPFVTLKLAETVDGFVAGGRHDPRINITGLAANGAVHVMRSLHDAIMVGIGTILADDPLMTVRLPGIDSKPTRIILDTQAHTPLTSRVIQTATDALVLIVVGADAPADRRTALSAIDGVRLLEGSLTADRRLDVAAVLHALAKQGLTRIFSEGGPTVGATLIAEGLADEVITFTAPRPLGREGVSTFSEDTKAALAERFKLVETKEYGVDRMRKYEAA